MSDASDQTVESYLSSLLYEEPQARCLVAPDASSKPIKTNPSVGLLDECLTTKSPQQSSRVRSSSLLERDPITRSQTTFDTVNRELIQSLLAPKLTVPDADAVELDASSPPQNQRVISVVDALKQSEMTPTVSVDGQSMPVNQSIANAKEQRPIELEHDGQIEWMENGRPKWAQDSFEVLLFKVGGLTLAVPLVALGQIYQLNDDLVPIFGQVNWFMGLLPTPRGKIRTINTALFVMPDRYTPESLEAVKFVITLDKAVWGLAVDQVQQPTRLSPDHVTWRTQRSKRPWLAGTVKSAMCALLDVPQMKKIFNEFDRSIKH